MPEIFLPPDALQYLRTFAGARLDDEMALAKQCAVSATPYRVPDRKERYLKFVSQLVCLYLVEART